MITEKNDSILVELKVIPKSSKNVFEKYGDKYKVKLKSPPVDGKANKELIAFLSKTFGLKKKNVTIINGLTSKNKTVKLENITKTEFLNICGG